MSDATLRFFPWMRHGIAAALTERADDDGVPASDSATVVATVQFDDEELSREAQVLGPGAVRAVSATQVVRREPRPDVTDFEPNYFPFVELASPDLPWQFTPAAARDDRLVPWLVLAVVQERDGIEFTDAVGDRLARLAILDGAAAELPPLREAWAWAHAQVTASGDVAEAWERDPGGFVARLMCPRRLLPDVSYRACLVPSFARGVQTGLGLAATAGATDLAWSDTTESVELPVYLFWRFRTSSAPGDFESLVERLVARTLAANVGVRDLDVGHPGSDRLPEAPGTHMGFQGAIVAPDLEVPPWDRDHRVAFRSGMASLLDEALSANAQPDPPGPYRALVHDPVVAPPAYGALEADRDAIPDGNTQPRWLRQVNVNPHQRATAGLGAEVVRRHQEELVASAWDQAGAIADANRALNQARLALEVGLRTKTRLEAMDVGTQLQITNGAHPRLRDTPEASLTVAGLVRRSELPDGLVTPALRRTLRLGSSIGKANRVAATLARPSLAGTVTRHFVTDPVAMQTYATLTVPHGTVFSQDQVTLGAPKSTRELVEAIDPDAFGFRGTLKPVVRQEPVRLGASFEGRVPRTPSVQSLPIRSEQPADREPRRRRRRTTSRVEVEELPEVKVAPAPPGRSGLSGVLDRIGRTFGGRSRRAPRPGASPAAPATLLSRPEVGFTLDRVVSAASAPPTSGPVALDELAKVTVQAMDPARLLRARVRDLIVAPSGALGNADVPASVSFLPEYPEPLSRWLADINPELLMPGIGDVPDDTVALAEVNASFVEAFLLGANDELRREFFWREVPVAATDTWLRTFWASTGSTVGDIRPVTAWKKGLLGTHQPARGVDPDRVRVLVVKGELLRRYPRTLVYAVPATTKDGQRVEEVGATREWPVFRGALGPRSTFLGFEFDFDDIDATLIGEAGTDRPGWFFVFEQPVTEPRFGLDIGDGSVPLPSWKDVSWGHVMGDGQATHVPLLPLAGTTLPIDRTRGGVLAPNTFDETWGTNSAGMAAITLQRPVRMLVHADQMLRVEESD